MIDYIEDISGKILEPSLFLNYKIKVGVFYFYVVNYKRKGLNGISYVI